MGVSIIKLLNQVKRLNNKKARLEREVEELKKFNRLLIQERRERHIESIKEIKS